MPGAVVHLELHTPNLREACAFYCGLLGWRPERVKSAGASYNALDLGAGFGGGMVECGTNRARGSPTSRWGTPRPRRNGRAGWERM